MVGEGDRLPPAKVWGLVQYVRTLAKKKESCKFELIEKLQCESQA